MNGAAFPSASAVALGGATALIDLSGVMVLPEASTLVVADLHLEKGSSFALGGQFLPPYDTRATLEALAAAIARFAPRRVIALGDSFHDRAAHRRLDSADRALLGQIMVGRDWLWIAGNHDPLPPGDIGGDVAAMVEIEGIRFVHEPTLMDGPEVAGHLHPSGRVHLRGRSVRRRCFATCGTRLVMPAFGAFTGGLNLRDAAFRPFFPGPVTAYMLGQSRLFAVPKAMLLPD